MNLSFNSKTLALRPRLILKNADAAPSLFRASKSHPKTVRLGNLFEHAVERLKEGDLTYTTMAAEILLGHRMHLSRLRIYSEPNLRLPWHRRMKLFENDLRRVANGEHTVVVTRKARFYRRSFRVPDGTFVPKAETENLVAVALKALDKIRAEKGADASFKGLDLFTGVGAVPITLALEFPNIFMMGTDRSEEAIEGAKDNAANLGALASQTRFNCHNICVGDIPNRGPFDIITGNPPYFPSEKSLMAARSKEPLEGYDGGKDGLRFFRVAFRKARPLIAPHGYLILEMDRSQASAVELVCKQSRLWPSFKSILYTRGSSMVFMASPRSDAALDEFDPHITRETPLITPTGGNYYHSMLLRPITRALETHFKGLENACANLKNKGPEVRRIQELIKLCKAQMGIVDTAHVPHEFEILCLHVQAAKIIAEHASPRFNRRRLNYYRLDEKQFSPGAMSHYIKIYVLMEILDQTLKKARAVHDGFVKHHRPELRKYNLEEFERFIKQADEYLEIADTFIENKRNKFNDKLSFYLLSNWKSISYGLGFLNRELSEFIGLFDPRTPAIAPATPTTEPPVSITEI